MFKRAPKRIYLDVAASSSATPGALKVYLDNIVLVGNPSSLHKEGLESKKVLEDARTRIARLAQVRPHNVIFTSGGTESNNLAILGIVRAHMTKGKKPEDIHVLYHAGGHSSVVECVKELGTQGVQIEPLALLQGVPDIEGIKKQIRSETLLVVLESVSGETGTMFDTRDVRRALDQVSAKTKTHIHLHVDASQAPRISPYVLSQLGSDSLTIDAQKVGAFRGIGALLLASDTKLAPLMHGGPQEKGRRPGTENPALASSFAVALEECDTGREAFVERTPRMREQFIASLSGIPDMVINESKNQAPHIVNLSFLKRDTDFLLFLLDAKGFAVSTKSACESGEAGSRMVALMTGDDARAKSTLRISFGGETKVEDLLACGKQIQKSIRFLDQNAIY